MHPHVLRVKEPLDDSRSAVVMVTEPVLCSLSDIMGDSWLECKDVPDSLAKRGISALEVKAGLQHIAEALRFLHRDARLYHLAIQPSNIYLTEGGIWKLGGFDFSKPSPHLSEVRARWCEACAGGVCQLRFFTLACAARSP